MLHPLRLLSLVLLLCLWADESCFAARGGELTLKAIDAETQQPLAVRIHLKNRRGRRVQPKASGAIHHGDHFVVDGETTLQLARGHYSFEMEAGPEYRARMGRFEIQDHAVDEKVVDMHRFANLAKEGWLAGDLHVARSRQQIDLLMRAEGLHVVPLVAEQNISGRFKNINVWRQEPIALAPQRWCGTSALFDHRAAGGLFFFHARPPAYLAKADKNTPFPLSVLQDPEPSANIARHIDIADPFSWGLPIWIAQAKPDTFQLIDGHALRNDAKAAATTGRPRDTFRYPGGIGTGRWAETIYDHLLNCGLRIPPSAGSGSGNTPNPPGQNRLYVFCGKPSSRRDEVPRIVEVTGTFQYDAWWQNLRAGRVVVTNGPLLRALVEGEPPGAIFPIEPGQAREFLVGLTLSTREKIEYLQVIKDGQIEHEVRLDQWAKAGGRLPAVEFKQSGWFLVRAVTNNTHVHQFATTGPFYVESGTGPRISHASTQFFLDWLAEIPDGLYEVDEIEFARTYWRDLLDRATAP